MPTAPDFRRACFPTAAPAAALALALAIAFAPSGAAGAAPSLGGTPAPPPSSRFT